MGNVVPSTTKSAKAYLCERKQYQIGCCFAAVQQQTIYSCMFVCVCLICLLKASASFQIPTIAIHFMRRIFLPQPCQSFCTTNTAHFIFNRKPYGKWWWQANNLTLKPKTHASNSSKCIRGCFCWISALFFFLLQILRMIAIPNHQRICKSLGFFIFLSSVPWIMLVAIYHRTKTIRSYHHSTFTFAFAYGSEI